MSWRYKLNACDTRLMRETWHHRPLVVGPNMNIHEDRHRRRRR